MINTLRNPRIRWLLPAFCLSFSTPCLAQADIDVGGSEADDYSGYDEPYSSDGGGENYGDGMPIVYAGDGMRVSIDQVDDSGVYARGTVVLGGGTPMRVELQMQMGQNGEMSIGQVQTPSGSKPIRAWDKNEEVTVAEFDGRRYRLVYQDTAYGQRGYDQETQGNQGDYGIRAPDKASRNNRSSPQPIVSDAGPKSVELVQHELAGSHTVLVPKGWKVEGGAWQPPPQAYSWMPSRYITVSGPDGSSVRFKPHFGAIYQRLTAVPSAQPGSMNARSGLINMPMPGNESEWAQWIEQDSIRSAYSDARDIRVTSVRIESALTENLRRKYAPMTQFMASYDSADSQTRSDQRAMTVESVYSTNGKQWQQLDAFNHFSNVGRIASAFGGADILEFWSTRDAVSLRAPQGSLDAQMPILLAIVNSLRQTPQYAQQLAQLQTKILKGNHEAAMRTIKTYTDISRSSYNANNEINAGIMNSYNERSASQDRGQRGFVNYINDQQDYSDPSTKSKVTLPASYDRVFSNGSGEYVLTNDASFEPGASWSSIQRTRY